jgi:hypothetical protein
LRKYRHVSFHKAGLGQRYIERTRFNTPLRTLVQWMEYHKHEYVDIIRVDAPDDTAFKLMKQLLGA